MPMRWGHELERSRTFLLRQLTENEHKRARLQNGSERANGTTLASGMNRLMRAADLERDILNELLENMMSEGALSLETALMVMRDRQEAIRQGPHAKLRRGQPISDEFWKAEATIGFLNRLLRQYHSWLSGEAYYPEQGAARARNGSTPNHGERYEFPWYRHTPSTHDMLVDDAVEENGEAHTALETLRDRMLAALRDAGIPDHHLQILVQPEGTVIAQGVVHNNQQRTNAIRVLLDQPEVLEAVMDISVREEGHCPVCQSLQERPTNGSGE